MANKADIVVCGLTVMCVMLIPIGFLISKLGDNAKSTLPIEHVQVDKVELNPSSTLIQEPRQISVSELTRLLDPDLDEFIQDQESYQQRFKSIVRDWETKVRKNIKGIKSGLIIFNNAPDKKLSLDQSRKITRLYITKTNNTISIAINKFKMDATERIRDLLIQEDHSKQRQDYLLTLSDRQIKYLNESHARLLLYSQQQLANVN